MLGYTCKYAPVELLEAMGAKTERISPQVTDFHQADIKMHPNLCSFIKGVLEEVFQKDYEGVVLTSCCDSTRRLYDVLQAEFPDKFIYLLDLPRTTEHGGAERYAQQLRTLTERYAAFCGRPFSPQALSDYLNAHPAHNACTPSPDRLNLGLAGARTEPQLRTLLERKGVNIAFDLTCTGLERALTVDGPDVMLGYAQTLLAQFPCMRMASDRERENRLREYAQQVDGILYHTVQFCDFYPYEYAWMNTVLQTPMLLLETDLTAQSAGQILTRTEAFLESLGWSAPSGAENGGAFTSSVYVMGVDSGSTSTNAVILDGQKNLLAWEVVRTGAKSAVSAETVLTNVLQKAGLRREQLRRIVSTGYGRVSIPYADETVTEISCHGRGAHYFNPDIRTILDIGGQDSKAIHLNDKGEVTDFVMNDKCAAGTGRFLEMIARTLEIDVSQLGPAALKSTEDIEITSMCSVFAESEVISLIAQNKELPDIANGVCRSIANKSYTLLRRVGLEPGFMMTGGVAKNPGVVRAVEEKLHAPLHICPEPEIVGAVGAALYALDKQ